MTPSFPLSFCCTLTNHLFGSCLPPLSTEADGDSHRDIASTLGLQGGFLFPQVKMGESDLGSHNSKSAFCDLPSLMNITKETQEESYSATCSGLLWIYLDIFVLLLDDNVNVRNCRNKCRENYSDYSLLFSMVDTCYRWLYIFKLIKIKCNKKFSPSVTVGTLQMISNHMWL